MVDFNIMEDFNNSSQDSSQGEEELETLEKYSRPAATSAATKSSVKEW